ncbi:MAG: LpxI family protein [Nitrospirae bacterium]|nr:MAG: LpxI family protein [Nitrospirota bacterium]
MKKIGIIAGKGSLPLMIASEAKKKGFHVVVIGLEPIADSINGDFDRVYRINVGKFGKLINTLKKEGIKEVIMAGKVSKTLLYKSKLVPDMRALKVLMKLPDRRDDTILQAITDELASEGIRLLETASLTDELFIPEGVLTKRKPTGDERADIEFGFKIAKEIGRLDIGQTVVVKDRAVMAVEAIEGTDEAIKRGGSLAKKGAVVVKVAKPQQDMRYDVPVVGLETLRSMKEVNASLLAAEAGKTILVDREEVIEFADKNKICVMGVKFRYDS